MDGTAMGTSGRIRLAAICFRLCAALLLLSGCDGKPASAPASLPPPKVTVSRPVRQNVIDALELTGNTRPVNTVQLRARVEGYLEKVYFKDGDPVKKDQPLFLIQQNTYQARLQQAEGNVLTQRALLEHARTELARYTTLVSRKAAAQTDEENWRYQRDAAQAALMTAEAQRDLARLDLGYTKVSAPFDGRIDRRLVDPGNLVGSGGSTVLAEITQLDPIYVYFNVSETDLSPALRSAAALLGKKGPERRCPVYVGITGDTGYPREGCLDFSATGVSNTTGTLLLRAVLSNADGKLLPGQFARIRLPVGTERSALLVPQASVAFDQLGSYLLAVNDGNLVERRNVRLGMFKEDMVVIEEGIDEKDRVVVKGLLRAVPGRQVSPEQPAPAPGP